MEHLGDPRLTDFKLRFPPIFSHLHSNAIIPAKCFVIYKDAILSARESHPSDYPAAANYTLSTVVFSFEVVLKYMHGLLTQVGRCYLNEASVTAPSEGAQARFHVTTPFDSALYHCPV